MDEIIQPTVVLLILSLITEKIANFIKLQNDTMAHRTNMSEDEKVRERKIQQLSIIVGIVVALAAKANLFDFFSKDFKLYWNKGDFEFFKLVALKYLNAPEMEGGKTPFGIDGGGLVQMVHRICGYTLGHSLEGLQRNGRKVDNQSAKPGDLVFLSTGNQATKSVGLLLEEGKILHVDGRVKVDMLTNNGVVDTDTKRESHLVESFKRYLND